VAARARSVEEFRTLMGRMLTPEGIARGLAFAPRPDDVIIAPFGKCGTTWLQQIVHTLRTRGDMDFDDISRVVPWIETSTDLGLELDAPQRAHPRAFKSHLSWYEVPKGARYIVSIRDPRDALVSMFRFMEGWFIEPGAVDANAFAREHWMRNGSASNPDQGSYWTHLASWWEQRHREDVLLLAYERTHADTAHCVRQVAAFCGIALDDELLTLTLEHASMPFMLRNKDRFDDHLMRELSVRRAGLPPDSDSAKVRKGAVGAHREELSEAVCAELDEIWRDTIGVRFGFRDYGELLAALDAEQTTR
jgi:hypothetical protein